MLGERQDHIYQVPV